MYGLLRKLPASHHFMATIFSMLIETGDPPASWSSSRIFLIYKANSTDNPSDFRMISLTGTCIIGKLYHQIQADRMTKYLVDSGVIDSRLQKAFLKVINGCIEHTQVMHEVLAHARVNRKTVHITYFNLTDAFGSVDHALIY